MTAYTEIDPAPPVPPDAVRPVTDSEVEALHAQGWARLDGLVRPEVVAVLLERLRARMGDAGDGEVSGGYGVKTPRPAASRALFNSYEYPSRDDAYVRDFASAPSLGSAFTTLAGGPVRTWGDNCFVKLPVTRSGGKTPWHQDFPYYPFDRCGSLTLWVALVDVTPERGSMRFVNGSHLWGPRGRVIGREDGLNSLDILPAWLKERAEISPPLDMKAGDATIHDDLTLHSAGENLTEDPRWVFQMGVFPADTLYTGAPNRRSDDLGLQVNAPLEHPNFPILPQ